MLERLLTPEEAAELDAKYGKPLGPLERNHKINKKMYLEMKEAGKSDCQICKDVHIHWTTLRTLKQEWKIDKAIRSVRKKSEKGLCKLCEDKEFVKGFCKTHYYKQWRWNHAN